MSSKSRQNIGQQELASAKQQTEALIESIRQCEDRTAESFIGHFTTSAAYTASEKRLVAFASATTRDPTVSLQQARAFWCAAQLLQRADHPTAGRRAKSYMAKAFAKIAEASEIGHRSIVVGKTRGKTLMPGTVVTARAPVRLDLAGGWSDTPPYCFEHGGHVVNIAINLNGKPPISAVVRVLRERKLVLESHDLGQKIELKRAELKKDVDVRDPFSLHKVALRMIGVPATGGLHLTTECAVPKGSGLGTSSILAATVLAALHKARGHDISTAELNEQTLLLEQRLSTGGGWQDQVGGILGGVKSTRTMPGVPQRPVIETLSLSDAMYDSLQDRLVVFFSGQQRLARDILRQVMGRWLAREPAVVQIEKDLKHGAESIRNALLHGKWKVIASEVERYWHLKQDIYSGSTTPTIDALLAELRDDYSAASLAGAGGGGFGFCLCKNAKQANRLRMRLGVYMSNSGSMGNVYDATINRAGLVVSVVKP